MSLKGKGKTMTKMKKNKIAFFKRTAAGILSAAMVLGTAAVPVQAETGYVEIDRSEIQLIVNPKAFSDVPQSSLSAVYYTSQYAGNPITLMFDGNASTFWETNWGSGATSFKSGDYFIIDLGESREDVARVIYTPRQDSANGRIKEYEIYTSNVSSLDGYELEDNGFELAGKGTWDADALTKTATFNSKTARYLAVKAYSVGGDGSTITCGEFNVAMKKDYAVDLSVAEEKLAEAEAIIAASDNEVTKEKLQEVLDRLAGDVSSYTEEGMEAFLEELQEAVDTYGNIGKVSSIRPGKAWVDTDGERIQAHGSNIIYDEMTKTYYWYGEHKGVDNISTGAETGTPAIGISCYSSKDLYNWTNEGIALPVFNNPQIVDGTGTDDTPLYLSEKTEEYQNSDLPEYGGYALSGNYMKAPYDTLSQYNTDEYIAELNALYQDMTLEEKQAIYAEFNWNRVVERPKVVYNENTEKYVMWWHQDGPTVGQYTVASGGVAISDSPTGPFKYLGTSRLPNVGNVYGSGGEGMLRDMTLFADDDGTGYLIYSSEDNATTIIMKLNEEYTAPSGNVEGEDYVRVFPGVYREAPAVFKDGDNYYMITSGQTGWNPNPCKYAVSTNGIMGDWSAPDFFCIDDITLNNEPAANPSAGTTYRSQSTNILPVRDADGNVVSGKFIYMGDRWFRENLQDSRYIWLPINLDSEAHTLTMEWKDEWTLEEEFGVTLPTPEPEPEPFVNPFTDVTEEDYFYPSVVWALENHVTTGDTPTNFAPYKTCNRAQIVLFLYRAMNGTVSDTACEFTDVNPADFYYEAMLWAVEKGITKGTTETTFDPWKACTRGEIVTFLWRAMGSEAVETDQVFPDVNEGDFFAEAVAWAVEAGVTTGLKDGSFGSLEECFRCDAVTFIHRAAEN